MSSNNQFSSVVNDNLSQVVLNSNYVHVPVTVTADLDLSSLSPDDMYFINNKTGTALAVTLPVNYAANKGRVLHFSNYQAQNIQAVAASSTAGKFWNITTNAAAAATNNVGAANLVGNLAGNWASIVCDGSTGWYVFQQN